jgi:hypothetical protein
MAMSSSTCDDPILRSVYSRDLGSVRPADAKRRLRVETIPNSTLSLDPQGVPPRERHRGPREEETANQKVVIWRTGTPIGTPTNQTGANSSQRNPTRAQPGLDKPESAIPNKPVVSHYESDGISFDGWLRSGHRVTLVAQSRDCGAMHANVKEDASKYLIRNVFS